MIRLEVNPGAPSDPNDDGIDQDCNGVDGLLKRPVEMQDDDSDELTDCDDPDCAENDYCLPESLCRQIDSDLDGGSTVLMMIVTAVDS